LHIARQARRTVGRDVGPTGAHTARRSTPRIQARATAPRESVPGNGLGVAVAVQRVGATSCTIRVVCIAADTRRTILVRIT
ncbi:MAG: hypothetical protein FD121_1653, partial [Gallionellaceae bacterium]